MFSLSGFIWVTLRPSHYSDILFLLENEVHSQEYNLSNIIWSALVPSFSPRSVISFKRTPASPNCLLLPSPRVTRWTRMSNRESGFTVYDTPPRRRGDEEPTSQGGAGQEECIILFFHERKPWDKEWETTHCDRLLFSPVLKIGC